MRIMIKSADDTFEPHVWDKTILRQWFDTNTDKEGNVQKEIVVYQDCFVTKADDGTFDWVLSDYSLDRDVERIDPAGWIMKEFKQNPIVLWAHDYWTPAIGKVLSPRVKDGKLIGKVQFGPDSDPLAKMIREKVESGIISAGSVGFKSKKVEITDEDKDEDAVLIHRKQILYEFSIVNIPSNQNARVQRDVVTEESREITQNAGEPELYLDRILFVCMQLDKKINELSKQINKGGMPKNYIEDLLAPKNETHETSGSHETSDKDDDHETSDLNQLFEKADTRTLENLFTGA